MAKRKRAPNEKPFSRPFQKSEEQADVAVSDETSDATHVEASQQFIGKWNQLISTTNWEKGQIICEWREALIESDADVTEYSDEAWSQLVGGVTSQHVGRLRRVWQRFGDVREQYEGLFWSHFQASIDWDDAEMWLEGSIQNGWSVSQMRGRRWETVGATPEQQQAEVAQLEAEQQSEAEAEETQAKSASADESTAEAAESLAPSNAAVNSLAESGEEEREDASDASAGESASAGGESTQEPVEKRVRLSVDVESLPDDLAEAFESFKLAIIAHRRENWRDTTVESVVECLESLKQLALADAE